MYTKNKVLFVSEMYCSLEQRSSTHIMIDNIIDGLIANQYEILFLVIGHSSEQRMLESRYQKKGITVIFWESRIPREIENKYQNLAVMCKVALRGIRIAQELLMKVLDFADKDTIILSHCPSVESAHLCRQIKKRKKLHYIQYWSDPISLSGILPGQFGIKRILFWILENQALQFADEIVYGTKILMTFQKHLFKWQKCKMRYVKISYIQKKSPVQQIVDDKFSLIYTGNYYSKIRDIIPLYEAMTHLPQYHLSVYGRSDHLLQDTLNVKIHDRMDSMKIQDVESTAQIQICILNRDCIQIPGKVFYNTDLNQRILVLLDGKYQEQIRQELEEYHRFEFCENKVDAIVEYLRTHTTSRSTVNQHILNRLSPEKIVHSIIYK